MSEVVMVCGSRKITPQIKDAINEFFERLHEFIPGNISEVQWVHGGAQGVDEYCGGVLRGLYGEFHASHVTVYKPEYDRYPPRVAPHIRNDAMLDRATLVVLFWDGNSPGTASVLRKCLDRNIPHIVVSP